MPPAFDPRPDYDVVEDTISVRDFRDYADEFVTRPPYQRKTVWAPKKQQALLDSLFRQYYVPRIVLRQVRLSDDRTLREVIDGQQRITTIQRFLRNELKLPESLEDLDPEFPGKTFEELSADHRRFVERLTYSADIIKRIDEPGDASHQEVASEIFHRLQLGESLNFMEIAHARLSSLARNFIVRYADDITFDFDSYRPVDDNPDKHDFFKLLNRSNDRMQHLSLLARLLIAERSDGAADLNDKAVTALVESTEQPDGIGNFSFADTPEAKEVLSDMNAFFTLFKDDPMRGEDGKIKELSVEYFIISMFLLLRHLRNHYVWDEEAGEHFRSFLIDFHQRWQDGREDDNDVLIFSARRQHTGSEVVARMRILRQIFFEYSTEKGFEVRTKDEKRGFSEAQRIKIYRHDDGLCQACIAEGKPEAEARVSWTEYEADHVLPHALGGLTKTGNGQVLCAEHNRRKGKRVTSG